MKLYYTQRSPYARKVRLLAIEKGLEKDLDLVEVDLKNKPADLLNVNPLGKIPALALADGSSLSDSPVICAFLDSLNKTPTLIPRSGPKRYAVLNVEGLADGICENAIGIFYETIKEPERQDTAVIHKYQGNILRTLGALETHYLKLLKSKRLTLAPIAAAAAIGYIHFRLPALGWEKQHKKLARWYKAFEARPSMQATMPKG
ncbi:MAG: glutathione S-transferase [Proteobacteria bacterium]|nr:glutathione S-transferase [Pseudomonadota bacterium]